MFLARRSSGDEVPDHDLARRPRAVVHRVLVGMRRDQVRGVEAFEDLTEFADREAEAERLADGLAGVRPEPRGAPEE